MEPKIYIETTIPSFYHETRTDAAALARQQWTRQWWDKHRQGYALLTSVAVLGELRSKGYPEQKRERSLALDR